MTWEQTPTDADWDRLVIALKSADSVLLIAHVSPDGDALGSALAVGIALNGLGISAAVSFGDSPFRLPNSLSWLPRQDLLVAPAKVPAEPDVVVSFDAGSLDRLGNLAPVALSAKLFAAVDHHRSHTGFAELSIVDVLAPATAVLALELVDRLDAPLTNDVATCIYTGLTTDTGSFRFAGTSAQTHRIAARLHDAGIAHDSIARAVFDTQSFDALRLLRLALTSANLDETAFNGLGMVWTQISRSDRDSLGLPLDAAEYVMDVIRTVSEAEVAVVVKEGDDGVWRLSTRSKGNVDLGQVCTSLGGGGHRFAAGFSAPGAGDEALVLLRAAITSSLVMRDATESV